MGKKITHQGSVTVIQENPQVCTRHPEKETFLRCSKCNTGICPECMIYTPIGARCPECADIRQLPMFQISSTTLLKGISAGLLSSLSLGYIWGVLFWALLKIPLISILSPLGIGYAIGELVSITVKRKRGPRLAYIVGLGIVISYVWTIFARPSALGYILSDVLLMGSMILAIVIGISRVK